MRLAVPLVLSAVAALALAPRVATACATCSCGDPTITSMGTEQAFPGRLRLSLGYLRRADVQGEPGVDDEHHDEQRLDLNVAYAPTRWLQLSASLPLVERRVTEVDLSRDTLRGSGDLELRARATLLRDRSFAPHHLAGLSAGVTLPTAGVERDATGDPLDLDHQAGGLAVTPRLGLFYLLLQHPWSLYASVSAAHVFQAFGDERAGDNLGATVSLQWQPGEVWGLRLGLDGKYEDRARSGHSLLADTGGGSLFLTPGLVYSPLVDLVFEAQLQLPVVNALYGAHTESPVLLVATSMDF